MLSFQSLMQEAKVAPRRGLKPPSLGRKEQKAAIATAIGALPEEMRVALGLRYYEALKPGEIAGVLGLEEEQVRGLLAAGLNEVVRQLEQSAKVAGGIHRGGKPAGTRRTAGRGRR